MKAKTYTTFESLPDMALIQVRPLVNFKVLPYSATTIWRKCRKGEFPAPIKMSSGTTAWREKVANHVLIKTFCLFDFIFVLISIIIILTRVKNTKKKITNRLFIYIMPDILLLFFFLLFLQFMKKRININ